MLLTSKNLNIYYPNNLEYYLLYSCMIPGVYKRRKPDFLIKKLLEEISKYIKLWPVEYPEIRENDRASPNNYTLNLDLLSK